MGDDGMQPVRHVHVAERVHDVASELRRAGVLALATFAALATLVLPTPVARPANAVAGSVATTGAVGGAPVAHTGRRGQRGESSRATWSMAGAASTGTQVSSVASPVMGSAGAGHSLVAAVPAPATVLPGVAVGLRPHDVAGGAGAAARGAASSRAPPTT
jgi:hypothetical protein